MITTKYDVDGKDIYVYDDVFSYSEIKNHYNYTTQLSFYKNNRDDTHINIPQSDLKWNCDFTKEHVQKYGLFTVYKKRLEFLKNNDVSIVRQYVNCSTFETVDNVHVDGSNIYTLIHFINFEWNINWFGETIFLNNDFTEIMKSIMLKPGRIILFDGSIPHSARTTSKICPYPRYNIVTKLIIQP